MPSKTIVKIYNPERISSETSIDMGEFFIVYNFDYNQETKCYIGNTKIKNQKALEYAKFNKEYECRYYKKSPKKIQSHTYQNQDSEFFLAFTICGIFTAAACILGK